MNQVELIVVLSASEPQAIALSSKSMLGTLQQQPDQIELQPIVPVFNLSSAGATPAALELARYLSGQGSPEAAARMAAQMIDRDDVEAAYVRPLPEDPIAPGAEPLAIGLIADVVPDFGPQQAYLNSSPGGVDARHAWTHEGGKGAQVRVLDIEGGWLFSHIDLRANSSGVVGGTPYDRRDHGTAVLGEIGGDENSFGVSGISPDAVLGAVSHQHIGPAGAIYLATQKLSEGDVLLLEMHIPGPRYQYAYRPDQRGYICVEWWPDILLAIQHAAARGIIVVEAAGNGAENLDDPLYDTGHPQFPTNWRNPLRGNPDSGAILVGAGAPPSGEHGLDRSRLDFSNHGNRVDCQGWGRNVVTTGYGDLFRLAQSPTLEDYWYTRSFSGTSSASPMVAGVAACLQGIATAKGTKLAPTTIRNSLRVVGAIQQGDLSQRIGPRPDLKELIRKLF